MATEAELKRRLPDNTLVNWTLRDAGGVDTLPTDPVSDAGVRAQLDVTLSSVRNAVQANPTSSLATQATLDSVLTELRRRPVYKVATAELSVAAGAVYVTVVSVTPTVPVVVAGYNADFESIISASYRIRLILGSDASPTVQHGEAVNTTANSWQPVKLTVAANTRIAIQVVHDQVTAQTVRATINYYEEP